MKKGLTIAGSDSSGGAGIQADLKTFSAHCVFGMSVITAVTAQNTQGVFAVQDISTDIIEKQIDAIFTDIEVDCLKIGMVSQTSTIKIIAKKLKEYQPKNIVLDPVMISKSGYDLLKPEAKDALISELLPLVTVVTPNIPEAEDITGMSIKDLKDMEKAALSIYKMGPKNVLIKGGHMEGDATDILFNGKDYIYYKEMRIETKNTHGTGCTLSSAIASNLANDYTIDEAISRAKEYITIAIKNSLSIGKGVGPTNHFYSLYKNSGMI
ncbi:bifunctional hydroxymethylpyrimidine kinase/phosphomethylpyrimidine kinase [Sporosalibacterium faouarense]|uniref:bifunctional hydroxymethylpyrimidine kinase/phosphomethylpyrimidine kinase n=1 Tax=Sporosalibacterium faouarense TaxID=516123 RepID=UPI00141C0F5D|nr:bifunctional hydroxymethylpyrimidine kinase/phosphomethylpyrimidine kinase [Sporosalibacterium faouarense]MTI47526.1 bifunctional hydroxymethylpyrimidine kinase/phosphomethylpyrimidine kinase [Bacillota bacterium]